MRVPKSIFVDLSTACNASCVMCPTQIYSGRKKIMSNELFEKIVAEVAPFASELNGFFFGVHGEPMLDKHLEKKLALCAQYGITKTIIATNGSLMNETRAHGILASKPWIILFSLESMNPEVYERIREGLFHEEIVANIKSFIKIRNDLDSPTRISIRFIDSVWNHEEKNEFVRYWTPFLDTEKRVDYIDAHPIHNWGLGDPGKYYGNTPCPHTECMTILSDGAVSACCLDYSAVHNFGMLSEQSITDVFNGPSALKFQATHLERKRDTLELCKRCDVAEFWANRVETDASSEMRFVASEWVSN